MHITQILIRPIVTEKTTRENEQGRYTFAVAQHATKIDIKNAMQALYGVMPHAVTVRPTPKKVRIVGRGRVITKRDSVKKATLHFEKGVKIDLYKFNKVEGKEPSKKSQKTKTTKAPKAKAAAA